MANELGLFIEQNNKQIISPQMFQTIQIMQLSLPELVDYINNELVENPLLEIDESEQEQSHPEKDLYEDKKGQDSYESWLEEVVDNIIQSEKDNWVVTSQQLHSQDIPERELWIDNSSLQEYLLEQLRFIHHVSRLSAKEYEAAEYIIGNLDDNGYLTTDLDEIALHLKASLPVVTKALSVVQKLDPLGIGARNLKECMKLQLPLIPDYPPNLELILDHLEDLAAGYLKKIATSLGITVHDVRMMAELLKLLDPKPGSRFGQYMDTKYIIPDAVIRKVGDEYIVLVNENEMPKIFINEDYRKALQAQDGQTIKRYLKEKVSSALNLLKSIEHRRSTIHDVLEAVVQRQREFLEDGVSGLKPLTMKEIAEELGLHESTVSRVASNKYVQTPRGLCPIKSFFAGSIGGEKEISPEKIKEDLKKLIISEDSAKPYSDQDLADLFKQKGIIIARRTIAKYREELRIPSSSLRKNTKR